MPSLQIESAIQRMELLENPAKFVDVSFVTPVLSTMLAARSMRGAIGDRIRFEGDAGAYAVNNGLSDALYGRYRFPTRGGLQGRTYTKLTRLESHAEVENCNAVVNDLIDTQFGPVSPVLSQKLRKVVGELHDNVASHSCGCGFSCVQVYRDGESSRVVFAVADAGCGMLSNVQRVRPDIVNHAGAIEWCLKRGNTTAQHRETGWEQRLPEDSLISPYPPGVHTAVSDDHHVGEGLWRLSQLVRFASGAMAMVSGDALQQQRGNAMEVREIRTSWSGVAVEVELTAQWGGKLPSQKEQELESLAERLGL